MDGLFIAHVAAGLALVAVVLAAAAWLAVRRRGPVEHRAWRYCGRCGWPAQGSPPPAPAVQRTNPPSGDTLPSDLLRTGWCRRGLAINSAGDGLTNTRPGDWQAPVAWSLTGAALGALGEPRLCGAYEQCASEVLDRWYGVSDITVWNRDPYRTQEEAVAVALEVERRLFGDR